MSEMCHYRTLTHRSKRYFDHLVGAGEQVGWEGDPEGGLCDPAHQECKTESYSRSVLTGTMCSSSPNSPAAVCRLRARFTLHMLPSEMP